MMYVYCFVPHPEQLHQRHLADEMLAALTSDDLSVSSNIHPDTALAPSLAATVAATHRPPLEHMDLIVVEGGREDSELGFLVAHAIATKKPILYLYPKGTRPALFDHVGVDSLPATVVTAAYAEHHIGQVITRFLHRVIGIVIRETPNIKFTLRITDRIDRYLQSKTKDSGQTKADFLRDQIEAMMNADPQWRHHRRQEKT